MSISKVSSRKSAALRGGASFGGELAVRHSGADSTGSQAPPVRQSSEEFIKKFGPLTVEVQQALTAVLLLDSPETNIVVDSLNALQKFLKKCDENKELYVEMGGLPPIKKRMFESHGVIQRMSMKILALTSSVHKAKLFLRDMELVKDLLALAGTQDDVIVEYSTYALSRLATLHTGRLQLTQNVSLPVLVGLLSHADPDIQRNSLETVFQIAADPLQVGLLGTNASYCEAVLKLVDSAFPPLQVISLLTLEKIACHPEGIPTLESVETFNVISAKLNDETMADIHRYCLRVLFHECRDRGTCKKFAYLTPVVASIVERTTDPMARVNGLELLGRLCSVELVAKNLAQCGIPQLIHNNLKSSDRRLKEACAFAIAQISRSVFSSKKDFAKCIPALLEMTQNGTTSERGLKCSLFAVSSIVEDTVNCVKEFINATGFDAYRRLLDNHTQYSADVVISALCTIDIIAGSPPDRPHLIDAGFLPILLTFLRTAKDPQVYTSVCNIIATILCDSATHGEFRSLNGPETLLNIINGEEFPVVVAAVPIINVASADPILGKVLLDMGLLQAMGNRTDLITHGPLRACFDRLIAANPTLKYAIAGHLSPDEKLDSGFCDVGGVKRLEELKLPQEFKWEGKNPRESVILLNLGVGKLDANLMKNNPSLNDKSDISDIIEIVKSQNQGLRTEAAVVGAVAKAVSDRFGGPLDNWRLTAKSEDIEIKNIQNQTRSVIVPVSSLTTGAFRTRALVFKGVCDAVGIPCSLETGDYKKAWNVVLLPPDGHTPVTMCSDENANDASYYSETLRKYVVDLAYQPGVLIPVGSFEAEAYITAY